MAFMRFFSSTPTNNQDDLSVIDDIEKKLVSTTNTEELKQFMTTISQSDEGFKNLYDAVKNLQSALRFNLRKQGQLLQLVFSNYQKIIDLMKSLDGMSATYDTWCNYLSDDYKQKHPEEYQSLEADVFKMFGAKLIKDYNQSKIFFDQFSKMIDADRSQYQKVADIYQSLISDYEKNSSYLSQVAKALSW